MKFEKKHDEPTDQPMIQTTENSIKVDNSNIITVANILLNLDTLDFISRQNLRLTLTLAQLREALDNYKNSIEYNLDSLMQCTRAALSYIDQKTKNYLADALKNKLA